MLTAVRPATDDSFVSEANVPLSFSPASAVPHVPFPADRTVVFHHSLRATVYWGPFEDFSKASSKTLQLLRAITNVFDHFQIFSKDFRRFSKYF